MPKDGDVLRDRSLYSSVASCSSGVELDWAQVVVVGNAPGVGGRYRIGHGVMTDALDQHGCRDASSSLMMIDHAGDPSVPAGALPTNPVFDDFDRPTYASLRAAAFDRGRVRRASEVSLIEKGDEAWTGAWPADVWIRLGRAGRA